MKITFYLFMHQRPHCKGSTPRVDPSKCCAGINLYDPSLLPKLQCTLQCIRHTQKCITGTQTFPISKLVDWKNTTAFDKWSAANRHLALKHVRQYWCYGNRSVVGNRGGWWILSNRVTLACLQQAGKLPRWTSHRNTTLRWGARTSAVLLRRRGNMSIRQQQMLIQNLNRIFMRPNVAPWQILHCITNCIPINLMFKENFP